MKPVTIARAQPHSNLVSLSSSQETASANRKESFDGCFMHVIHQLHVAIEKHLEHVLSLHEEKLSLSQFMILVRFSCSPSSFMTQAKLASDLDLTEATISRHTQTLVSKKFLTKERDIMNRKSYNLKLSPLGKKTLMSAKKLIMGELDACFSHISEIDKKTIIGDFTTTLRFLQQKK